MALPSLHIKLVASLSDERYVVMDERGRWIKRFQTQHEASAYIPTDALVSRIRTCHYCNAGFVGMAHDICKKCGKYQ